MLKGDSALVTPFVQMSPFHVPVGCNFFLAFLVCTVFRGGVWARG